MKRIFIAGLYKRKFSAVKKVLLCASIYTWERGVLKDAYKVEKINLIRVSSGFDNEFELVI